MGREAAVPTTYCSSLITILLIFSLKILGRIGGPEHLAPPTLGVACFELLWGWNTVLPPLLLLTRLTNLQGLEAFLPSGFILLTVKKTPKVGYLPVARQLPKERAINPTGVKILLSRYAGFGGSSLAKSHFILKPCYAGCRKQAWVRLFVNCGCCDRRGKAALGASAGPGCGRESTRACLRAPTPV